MSKVTIERTIKLETEYNQWDGIKTALEDNDIWFIETDNENGYNQIDCGGDNNPIPILLGLGVINLEQSHSISFYNPQTIIVVFR